MQYSNKVELERCEHKMEISSYLKVLFCPGDYRNAFGEFQHPEIDIVFKTGKLPLIMRRLADLYRCQEYTNSGSGVNCTHVYM
jgi:hypothetical protein